MKMVLNLRRFFILFSIITSPIYTIGCNPDVEIKNDPDGQIDFSDQIGKPLTPWKYGQMDICQINTGRGENYFIIFPDSTSLLIDVGDIRPDEFANPPRPNDTKSAGEWVAGFVKDVNPRKENVDYYHSSHLHPDHIGSVLTSSVVSTDKGLLNYEPTGISQAADFLNISKLVDRGYPGYNYPQDVSGYPDIANYRKFVEWKKQSAGLVTEQFEVGSDNQFKMNYKPEEFPSFKVQNLFANGLVWTGAGKQVVDYIHKNDKNFASTINENTLSCGMKMTYGNFSFFTGGDVYGTLLDENDVKINMESAIKNNIGEVDVCKANHHCFTGSMIPDFVNTISAKIYLLSYLNSKHLKTPVLTNLATNPKNGKNCLMVPTYLSNDQKISIMSMSFYNQITVTGHVVIRVLEGGNSYLLYILNDEDELKTVKAVYGPFVSKKIAL